MTQSRNTPTKQTIRSLLETSSLPLRLQDIAEAARQVHSNIAFSTVYRIVQNLIERGDVIQVDWRERGARYEWAHREHHHHVSCTDCGNIADIDDASLNLNLTRVSQRTGFIIQHHSIELEGICQNCQNG